MTTEVATSFVKSHEKNQPIQVNPTQSLEARLALHILCLQGKYGRHLAAHRIEIRAGTCLTKTNTKIPF